MDKMERFNALIGYIESNPEIMERHGKLGVAVMEQIVRACNAQSQTALDEGIDAFMELVAGGQSMRGITPSAPTSSVEQFNRIEKATKAVLEKIARAR
jgi:hypothetical protein